MPINEKYGEVEYDEYVGQLSGLREETSSFGNFQIVADLKSVDPDVEYPRLEFFPASRRAGSRWMTFLEEVQELGYPTKNPNKLIGLFFHIQKRPEPYDFENAEGERIQGVKQVPHALAVTDNEEVAQEWFEGLPKLELPPPPVSIDIETQGELVSLYKGLKKNDETFLKHVVDQLPEGMTAEEALELVQELT